MRSLSACCLTFLLAACAGANVSLDGGVDLKGDDGGGAPGPDASSPAKADAGVPADPTVAAWLKEHNDVRANAQPIPSPALPALIWNADAAAVAGAWAAKCTWNHNSSRGSYGENISAATYALTPAQVVAGWAEEVADYDYATNGCSGTCGHYTQLVWRTTTSVGCAVQKCTTNSPFSAGTWWFAVCDYAPPGNWVGQKPY
ncbi:MAG: CAP domain-containing protein [Myxococcales bacterium]